VSAHTKGPWKYEAPREFADPLVIRGLSGGFAVMDYDKERAIADAKLIAAAPDLLSALESINIHACYASEEDIDSRESVLLAIGDIARAAIKKATGSAT
jgi:hypothetical protein